MTNNELKLDIQDQIFKTNKSLNSIWSKIYFNGLKNKEFNSFSTLLKKVKRDYKFNAVIAILIAAVLIVFIILKFSDLILTLDLNRVALFLLIAIASFFNTFRIYKLKVNLEHKVYLLQLLEKME
jgi:hypothetical protein